MKWTGGILLQEAHSRSMSARLLCWLLDDWGQGLVAFTEPHRRDAGLKTSTWFPSALLSRSWKLISLVLLRVLLREVEGLERWDLCLPAFIKSLTRELEEQGGVILFHHNNISFIGSLVIRTKNANNRIWISHAHHSSSDSSTVMRMQP